MKCSITKQIVTDNKVIIHVVLNQTTHSWHSEWVPRPWTLHSLSYPVSKDAVIPKNVRKCCFRSTKSLICSVDYSVHPDAGCAINTQLQCKGFSNWILAFTDTRVEPPPAIAPPPQWAAPFCMVYVNPRSPFCDLHCRVRHQKHLERL